jgi:hypothetical protein
MRLSEAILLGSTVVRPKAGALRFSGENSGCALGMAVIASGGSFRQAKRPLPETERRTLNVEDVWGAWLLERVDRPCDCRVPLMLNRLRRKKIAAYRRYPLSALPREMRIKDVVAHLFDYHVMEKADWTLDRLTTWLKPLEPNEPSEASSIGGKGDLPSDDAEWRETRQAFEAKMKTKRHRFAGEAD